jgi:RHS repeat-associated protein
VPCSGSYPLGTIVTLTAVPDPGSTFAGWGGSCAGAVSGPCVVQLNGDRFVSATFTKTPNHIATTYYHTDVIGSVRAITDETGAVVSRHDYLPFGEDTQPLTGDPMRFAGKELDPESALQNFEARYYRNTWGRFTQVDPVSGSLSDTQSWNRYAYARNNPMRFADPTGMQFRTGVDQDCGGCLDPPPTNMGGGYDGSGMNAERYGMTAGSGNVGPNGCGYSVDGNGNFYMWDQFCETNEFQPSPQVPEKPTNPTDPPNPTNPCPTSLSPVACQSGGGDNTGGDDGNKGGDGDKGGIAQKLCSLVPDGWIAGGSVGLGMLAGGSFSFDVSIDFRTGVVTKSGAAGFRGGLFMDGAGASATTGPVWGNASALKGSAGVGVGSLAGEVDAGHHAVALRAGVGVGLRTVRKGGGASAGPVGGSVSGYLPPSAVPGLSFMNTLVGACR